KRLERELFRLTKDMTVKAASERMDLDWETVKDSEIRYIRGLLRKSKLDGITRIGIDEVSHQKGHRYLTLVTDMDHRRVPRRTMRPTPTGFGSSPHTTGRRPGNRRLDRRGDPRTVHPYGHAQPLANRHNRQRLQPTWLPGRTPRG
ncbi:MAG: hypothetical protein V1929_00970, partial [bacterium]